MAHRAPEQQLRVPVAFATPLSAQAMSQLSETLARQPTNTITQLRSHLDATLARNPRFMERLQDLVAMETARHDMDSRPDPNLPINERERTAREQVLKEIIGALRTGRLQLPEQASRGAEQVVRAALENCMQVIDDAGHELRPK